MQKTSNDLRISDWSSDVCSSDLEGTEDDLGQGLKIVQDQRESADIENLLQELRDNIVLAAERPEQPCERDVDPDQDGGQKADVGSAKAEAAVNVSDDRLHELKIGRAACRERVCKYV